MEATLKYGIHLPLFGDFCEPAVAGTLARQAEEAGWDGIFVWDHISPPWNRWAGDAVVSLSAMAAQTSQIRLGPMVMPLARRRPWKVARETVALDRLSGGRLVLGAGVGGFKREFADLGEESSQRARAEMLDEGLEVLTGLWSGKAFTHAGRFYSVTDQTFLPTPIQEPRIPIWIAAKWPAQAPIERAARWDGVFPTLGNVDDEEALARLRRIISAVKAARTDDSHFDVVRGGETSGNGQPGEQRMLERHAEAGVTWWLENINPTRWGGWDPWPTDEMIKRIKQGPPHSGA